MGGAGVEELYLQINRWSVASRRDGGVCAPLACTSPSPDTCPDTCPSKPSPFSGSCLGYLGLKKYNQCSSKNISNAQFKMISTLIHTKRKGATSFRISSSQKYMEYMIQNEHQVVLKYFTWGPIYNELGYNEHPSVTSNFVSFRIEHLRIHQSKTVWLQRVSLTTSKFL